MVRDGYPDHTAWDSESEHPDPRSSPEKPIWFMVDIKAQTALPESVSLGQIKSHPGLENCSLFKRPRLSIHPITAEEWDLITGMGA